MKPFVRRSTRPAPKFYKPATRQDENGIVIVPDVKLVKYGTGMGKSTCLDLLAERLIYRHRINKSNLASVGKRIAGDYSNIEGCSAKDIYHLMSVLVEGAEIFKSIPVEALFVFRKAYYDNNQLGPDHPYVMQEKKHFMEKAGFKVPEEIWKVVPQQSAENALKEYVLAYRNIKK